MTPLELLREYVDDCDGIPDSSEATVPLVYLRAAVKALDASQPAYPQGEVRGPCVCGSWPGGRCFRCEWRPADSHLSTPEAA